MRVLIIDDNEDDRRLIRRLMPQVEETREAGTLALAYTVLSRSDWKPDAILLDLHLPDGNGPAGESWDAVAILAKHAPVIVVSAQSLVDDPFLGRQAKTAGAAGFTSKELIIFSPEHLARQLDWAVSPAARSLAQAVADPGAAPEFSEYNPNSLPALIARLITQQDAMHSENQTAAIQRKEQLDRIEEQVQHTNGRVTKLENWRDNQAKALKTAAQVGSAAAVLIGFFFGPQLKDRVLIDTPAVRKIADEQVAAALAKPTPPPVLTSPPST